MKTTLEEDLLRLFSIGLIITESMLHAVYNFRNLWFMLNLKLTEYQSMDCDLPSTPALSGVPG